MGALEVCPHMTARCPHKRDECDDSKSKQCHYISVSTSSALTTVAAFSGCDLDRLSPEIKKRVELAKEFLRDIDNRNGNEQKLGY